MRRRPSSPQPSPPEMRTMNRQVLPSMLLSVFIVCFFAVALRPIESPGGRPDVQATTTPASAPPDDGPTTASTTTVDVPADPPPTGSDPGPSGVPDDEPTPTETTPPGESTPAV